MKTFVLCLLALVAAGFPKEGTQHTIYPLDLARSSAFGYKPLIKINSSLDEVLEPMLPRLMEANKLNSLHLATSSSISRRISMRGGGGFSILIFYTYIKPGNYYF